MEKYQPQHPSLFKTHTIQEHANTMENLQSLTTHQIEEISSGIVNSIPLLASKNEIAFWCHVQHYLERRSIITPGMNVYCMYILEKHHLADNEESGTLERIKNILEA